MVRKLGLSVLVGSALLSLTLRGAADHAVDASTTGRFDPVHFKALKWRLAGPTRGGRSVAVAGSLRDPMLFYFGSTGGGVWKTGDGGHTWANVSDGYFKTGSVGAIAVAESDPNIIYVGMGEACIRGDLSHGDGVYRSTDGGKSWTHVGLGDSRHIARIRIHPKNPAIVFVAALGDAWGPSAQRGVFRSRDGGKTWEPVLARSERAGAIDLSMSSQDPRVLYAALWDAQRYPWGLRSGGKDTAIYKSVDGGDTWVDISNHPGLPRGLKGRIGLSVSPARPDRVWAIIEAEGGQTGLYRSEDSGSTWGLASDDPSLVQRPWYYQHVVADPKDPETVYVMNTALRKSSDGGRTWTRLRSPHGDSHDLWIASNDPRRMIEGNDGGATITFNGGTSWSRQDNQPTAQFYHVTADNQFPYRLYATQQDNTSISVPSRASYGNVDGADWYAVGGGEDGYIAVRSDDPNIVFAGDHHWLTRYDHRTRQVKLVSPWPEMYRGWGARDLRYRFQWVYPILLSPHDPTLLYAAANHVFKSTDQGHSWEIISPDLTRNDQSKLEPTPSGGEVATGEYWGPITRDNTGIEWYCTIFALAESPREKGLLWAGSDDGLIHVSRDGGKTWVNVTPGGLPEWALINMIEASPHDPGTAYVAATRYKLQDQAPYLYRTTDYGKTWKTITNGIRPKDFTRVIREDPVRRGLLYAGTETGVYASFDGGESWQSLQLNLPIVPIHDMIIKDNDLVVATHGRAFWILDDVTPLQQVTEEAFSEPVRLFKPRKTVRFRGAGGPGEEGGESGSSAVQDAPAGVIINYYLKDQASSKVSLSMLDNEGKAIRTFSSGETRGAPVTAEPGLNRFIWDMRYPGPIELAGDVFRPSQPTGPLAVPGTYQVRLSVGQSSATEKFEIAKDPRLTVAASEFNQQFELLMRIQDKLSDVHNAVIRVRELRREIAKKIAASQAKTDASRAVQAGMSAEDKLARIEDALSQRRAKVPHALNNYPNRLNNKLAALAGHIERGDGPPTKQEYEAFEDLAAKADQEIARLRQVVDTDVAVFKKLAK
ncbi:MAG: glycosyl hydrolase [Acidobacteria bacterium]|nr:glycosyl hydrolase [Acidobacteriota bacterium]